MRHSERFLFVRETLNENTYVDDILMGAHTIKKLNEIKIEITNLLECAEIELHKCLDNLKLKKNYNCEFKDLKDKDDASSKILKISSRPGEDSIVISHALY